MARRHHLGIPSCPDELTADLEEVIEQFARVWQASSHRPRITKRCAARWNSLLNEWIAADDLPVLIRSSAEKRRGRELRHANNRIVVCTDNSPAHWSMALALQGRCPTLDEIRGMFKADQVPVCMVMTVQEREHAKYRCSRQTVSLNKLGWKVCHRAPVGERRPRISEIASWDRITEHFRRLLSPGNMFLVPLKWGGLGELAGVIKAMGLNP